MSDPHKSVLFIGAFPEPALLERYVSGDLALRLELLGWKVRVTSRCAGRLARFCQLAWDTWRRGKEGEIACVDVYSGPAFVWAEIVCTILRRLRKPYVLTLHGGSLPEFADRYPGRVRKLLHSAAVVTCPSTYLLDRMRHVRPDLVLLPNGLELANYPFRDTRPPLKQLLWLRAFHDIYNPELAVEVVARLRRQHDVHLTMIGPDKRDGSLERTKQAAARLGMEGAVSFRGAVAKSNVPTELAQADLFLNTTNFDNTPVSVLEAMACGLPVVSTDVGGITYLLQDGETALLTPAGNAEALAGAVSRLILEPDLATRLTRNARKQVESYDWGIVLPRWEKLLLGVINANHLAKPAKGSVEEVLHEFSGRG